MSCFLTERMRRVEVHGSTSATMPRVIMLPLAMSYFRSHIFILAGAIRIARSEATQGRFYRHSQSEKVNFQGISWGEMFKPASYLEKPEVRVLPAALIGIHFHFPVVLNVKNRAHAKCFEFAEEGLGPQVGSVESILLYYEEPGQPVTRRPVTGRYYRA